MTDDALHLTEEDRVWIAVGSEDVARALVATEAEIPGEVLGAYLQEVEKRVTPVKWDPRRREFEVVRT